MPIFSKKTLRIDRFRCFLLLTAQNHKYGSIKSSLTIATSGYYRFKGLGSYLSGCFLRSSESHCLFIEETITPKLQASFWYYCVAFIRMNGFSSVLDVINRCWIVRIVPVKRLLCWCTEACAHARSLNVIRTM